MVHVRRSRRGTEKPIEIFVALFVILAVALVMLKLFQSQITEKQKQLTDFQQEQKAQELRESVSLACQVKCTQASNNGCSLQSLATLCMAGSGQVLDDGEYLDLDQNNRKNYNVESFGGVGVCEDQVYCFNGILDKCCDQKITPTSCMTILTDFWNSQGYDAAKQKSLTCKYLNKGNCVESGDDLSIAWWNVTGYPTCS